MSMQVKQQGFTLIELIVVITILGILAAFALPRFVDLQKDARIATVNGLAGSLKSASAMVHAKALARGVSAGDLDIGEGQIVKLSNGYATAATISSALQDLSGFTTPSSGVFQAEGATKSDDCAVTYIEGNPPTIRTASTGC